MAGAKTPSPAPGIIGRDRHILVILAPAPGLRKCLPGAGNSRHRESRSFTDYNLLQSIAIYYNLLQYIIQSIAICQEYIVINCNTLQSKAIYSKILQYIANYSNIFNIIIYCNLFQRWSNHCEDLNSISKQEAFLESIIVVGNDKSSNPTYRTL